MEAENTMEIDKQEGKEAEQTPSETQKQNEKTYQEVTTVVMKNWEPFVSRPALAMDRRPGRVCFKVKFSSANLAL